MLVETDLREEAIFVPVPKTKTPLPQLESRSRGVLFYRN